MFVLGSITAAAQVGVAQDAVDVIVHVLSGAVARFAFADSVALESFALVVVVVAAAFEDVAEAVAAFFVAAEAVAVVAFAAVVVAFAAVVAGSDLVAYLR